MQRLALVGPGRWGRILVESVQGVSKTVIFTQAVARSPAKAAEWCAAQGIALSDDLTTVLSDPQIDGVVLATPHSQHKDQIMQVAQAGKDLFCEKPIALTLADAKTALQEVKNAGIVFAAGHNRRFLPVVERMKTMVTSGDLGTILHIEGNMSSHVGFDEIYTSDMWRVAPGESPAGGVRRCRYSCDRHYDPSIRTSHVCYSAKVIVSCTRSTMMTSHLCCFSSITAPRATSLP